MKPGLSWLLIIGCGLLTACTGTATPTSAPQPTTTPVLASPTVVTPTATETPPPPTQSESVTRQPTPTALRFTFPTPGAVPVSIWRAPLYDTPWALSPYDHFLFTRPISVDEVNWPLPDYRYGGVFFDDVVHSGIDIDASPSTPVLAAAPGRVIWVGYGLFRRVKDPNDPYGLAVEIEHDFTYQGKRIYTVYAHMDSANVVLGQHVETGDQLGLVGDTGETTGPHLHFEIRLLEGEYTQTRNPELWLSPPQGSGVLVGRVLNEYGYFYPDQEIQVTNLDTGQKWKVKTYGLTAVYSDDYYHENMVLSDLPAGNYEVMLKKGYYYRSIEVAIHPGAVTYVTYRGYKGFDANPPPTPDPQSFLEPQE